MNYKQLISELEIQIDDISHESICELICITVILIMNSFMISRFITCVWFHHDHDIYDFRIKNSYMNSDGWILSYQFTIFYMAIKPHIYSFGHLTLAVLHVFVLRSFINLIKLLQNLMKLLPNYIMVWEKFYCKFISDIIVNDYTTKRDWNLDIYSKTLFCFIFNWSVYPLFPVQKVAHRPELHRVRER